LGIAERLRQSASALAQGGINLIKDSSLNNAAFGNTMLAAITVKPAKN
jgi:hypothetical protein